MIDPIKSPYPREQLPAKHPLTLLSFFDLSAYLCAMAFCLFVTWNIRDNVRAMSSNPWDLIFPLACTVFFALGVVVVSPFAYRIQGAVAWGATATVLVTAILYLGQWNVPFQLVVVTTPVAGGGFCVAAGEVA